MTDQNGRIPRILVVEDSRTQAEELRMILEEEYAVEVVGDGSTALERARAESFDAVISDILMPGLNGFDLCQALKHEDGLRRLPVILLTALANPRDVLRGLEVGADNYITKPFDPDVLLQRLRLLLALPARPEAMTDDPATVVESFGRRYSIQSDRSQVVRLLVSSLEDTVATNDRLKAAQDELLARNATLVKLNDEKNRFMGIAAHDLRNPIGAIRSFSDLLLSEDFTPTVEERTVFLTHIRESSDFMLRLLSDLLDISKIESGHLNLELRATDLRKLLRDNVTRHAMVAARKVITVRLFDDSPIDPVVVDPTKMEQVFNNLISNAIKFSHQGTTIDVRLERQGSEVIVCVQDQGQGIPAAELGKLFKPFQKTSTATTGGESSTGLGLAIVRRIVEGHGGRVWVESELGHGSRFSVALPAP